MGLKKILASEGLLKKGSPTDRQYLNLINRLSDPLPPVDRDSVALIDVRRKPGGFAVWSSGLGDWSRGGLGWLPFDVEDAEVLRSSRGKISPDQLYSWLKSQGGSVKGRSSSKRKTVPDSIALRYGPYSTAGKNVFDPNGKKIGEVIPSDWPGGFDVYQGSGTNPRYRDSLKGRIPAIRKLIRLHLGKTR